jgi:DNA-binding transcriptional regulator YdaS (Cro superfamily)
MANKLKNAPETEKKALLDAIQQAGSIRKLALFCGVSRQRVQYWMKPTVRIKPEWARKIAANTIGITAHQLRGQD